MSQLLLEVQGRLYLDSFTGLTTYWPSISSQQGHPEVLHLPLLPSVVQIIVFDQDVIWLVPLKPLQVGEATVVGIVATLTCINSLCPPCTTG